MNPGIEMGPPPVNKLTFDEFWNNNQEEMRQSLNSDLPTWMFSRKAAKTLGTPQEASAETLQAMAVEKMLQNEKKFASRVYDVTNQAIQEKGKAIALFDIDFTLAETDADEYKIRPSVPKLFSELLEPLKQSGKLDIGLLSTKNREATLHYLKRPDCLGPINQFINPDLVYSCRDTLKSEIHEKYVDGIPVAAIKEKYCGTDGIVDNECLDALPQDQTISTDDYQKPTVLQQIRAEHPVEAIIAVDDVVYPTLLRKDQGFYGVPIQDCKYMTVEHL